MAVCNSASGSGKVACVSNLMPVVWYLLLQVDIFRTKNPLLQARTQGANWRVAS